MNKKLFVLLTASVVSLFFACSGDVVESTETSNRAKLALTVTVQDIVSGELLEADVSLNDGKAQQSKSGVAVFDDVSTGTHTLQAKKYGYAAALVSPIEVDLVTGQNAQIKRDYAATLKLYPLTSSLWGYINYTDENGVTKPAAGVSVNLRLGDRFGSIADTVFVNKLYTVITDATGKYFIDSLPAVGTNYTLWVSESKIGNIEYASATISPANSLKTAGSFNATANAFELTEKTNLFVASEYPSTIELADIANPITFKFTEAVNKNKLTATSISVSGSTAANIVWNATYTEVTLTPMGNWKGLSSIILNLTSISGTPLSENYPITVALEDLSAITVLPEFLASNYVDPTKIDYDSRIFIKFPKVPGATNYSVYTNNNAQGIYNVTPASTIAETEDSRTVSIVNPNGQTITKEVGILVQALNTNSKTILDETKALKIKDVVNPTYLSATKGQFQVSGNGGALATILDTLYATRYLSFGTSDYTTPTSTISFSEPIQLDKVEVLLVNELDGSPVPFARAKVERVWTLDNREIAFKLTTTGSSTPLSTATNLKATVIIKNIFDQSGLPFEVTYVNTSGTPIAAAKNQVAIRYITNY